MALESGGRNFSLLYLIHTGFPFRQMTFYVIRQKRRKVALFHDHGGTQINLLKLPMNMRHSTGPWIPEAACVELLLTVD